MTPVEAVKFVQFVNALWPQQRLEEATPDAWYAAGLKDVDAGDASEAATRLASHKAFISLAEIMNEVRTLRAERIARVPLPAPPAELADQPRDYKAAFQAGLAKLARGFELPKQITAKVEPSTEYVEIRGGDHDPIRIAAIRVPCPWPPCKALPGAVCKDADGRRLAAPAHEARLKAAGLDQVAQRPGDVS